MSQSITRLWIDWETCDEITESHLPANGKILGEDKKIEYLTIERLKALKEATANAREGICYCTAKDFAEECV